MTRTRRQWRALAGVAGVVALLALPAPPAFGDALRDLDAFFKIETFRANFVQQVYAADGGEPETVSEGVALFHRPGRFRWEYALPDPLLIITDGLHLLIYDSELRQAYVQPTMSALGSAPLLLLLHGSHRSMFEDFRVEYIEHGDDLEWLRLKPKADDTGFVQFDVGFKGGMLASMVLYDRFGQRTRVRFNGVETGVAIPAERFRVNLPEGVDIIGSHLR